MIKLLILCEGNTDQILIGSYIERNCGWAYSSVMKNRPFESESINWYQKDGNTLAIWDCNGYPFNEQLCSICKRENHEHIIENLLIITDHDDDKVESSRAKDIQNVLNSELKVSNSVKLVTNKWTEIAYDSGFGKVNCNVGFLIIPIEEQGALEVFMLKVLAENKEDAENTIEQVKHFIDEYKSQVYLRKRRDKVKAQLGISLSIFNPDKSFRIMKEIIDSVDWNESETAYRQFKMIDECLDS